MTFTKSTQTEFKTVTEHTQTDIKVYCETACQTDPTTAEKHTEKNFKLISTVTCEPMINEIKSETVDSDKLNESSVKSETLGDNTLVFVQTEPGSNIQTRCSTPEQISYTDDSSLKFDPLEISIDDRQLQRSNKTTVEIKDEDDADMQEDCPLSVIASRLNHNSETDGIEPKAAESPVKSKHKNAKSETKTRRKLQNLELETHDDIHETNIDIKRKKKVDACDSEPIAKKSNTKTTPKKKGILQHEVKHSAQYYIDNAAKEYNDKQNTVLEEVIRNIQQQWRIHERSFRTHSITKKKIETEKVTEENEEEIAKKLRMSQGRRYEKEFKFLSLNLYYSNKSAYIALRKQLNLPAEKTLRRIDVGVSTKLKDTVLKCLKLMAERLNEDERNCIICADLLPVTAKIHKLSGTTKIVGYNEIDEVQSEEPATQVLIVMVRSIVSDWKQPIICCYLKENFDYAEVISWLDNIIAKVIEVGLNVMALTTKPDRHFVTMSTMRNISTEHPYFHVGEQKIYQIFDVPSLIVSLRDLLMDHNIEYVNIDKRQYTASWEDIQKLYVSDINRLYKLAPKINEHHIRPHELDKLRVDLAAQLFSNTVASALNQCIELKVLTEKSIGSVKLIGLLNNVFDVLNSSIEKGTTNYQLPFSDKPHQKDVLGHILNVLQTFKVIDQHNQDITSGVEEIKCMEVSIHAVLGVASDLKAMGNQILFTRNLSLECLHNYILYTRKTWGQKTTPIMFRGSFRTFYLQHVIKKSENNSSCGLDKELISVLMYKEE